MKLTNPFKLSLLAVALALAALAIHTVRAEEKKDVAKPYPLEKCIVSDEKLGEMGKPFVFTHEGQEIKLCCKSCQKDFKKDPAKYLKKLEGAGKADKK
jgi:YHS domain-containing protein